MFQLVIAVIAIALVMALTLASVFYGGEAFTKAQEKARLAEGKPAISRSVEQEPSVLNRFWATKDAF